MLEISDLIFLFASSFLAATIVPAQSEMVLVAISLTKNYPALLLLTIATFGNVLGSVVNYFLGYYLVKFKDRKWFPVSEKQITKYGKLYQKWGVWSLLLAFLPIIGDPLTLVAGIFRTNVWLFLLLVTIGKFSRYYVLLLALGGLQ